MKNQEILTRLIKIGLQPKKEGNLWICITNGHTYTSSSLAGLFGIPSPSAKELTFLTKKP